MCMTTLHTHQSPFFTFTKLIPYSPQSICSPSSYPPITPHTHRTCYHYLSFHHSFPTSSFPFFFMCMQPVCMTTSVHAWPPLLNDFLRRKSLYYKIYLKMELGWCYLKETLWPLVILHYLSITVLNRPLK